MQPWIIWKYTGKLNQRVQRNTHCTSKPFKRQNCRKTIYKIVKSFLGLLVGNGLTVLSCLCAENVHVAGAKRDRNSVAGIGIQREVASVRRVS